MTPSQDVGAGGEEVDMNVRISIPIHSEARRRPVDICVCVDVSGSMQLLAEYENEEGKVTDDGLSFLDIVKHATKAIMFQMDEDDRMGLVTYSQNSEEIFPLTSMT
jgi:hypothetical protein